MRRELAGHGIRIVDWSERPERHLELRQLFIDEIFPVLTPLAVDPGHPFPFISDLSLSLAVTVLDPDNGDRGFARIKVPATSVLLKSAPVEVRVRTFMLHRGDHRGEPRRAVPRHGDPRAPRCSGSRATPTWRSRTRGR